MERDEFLTLYTHGLSACAAMSLLPASTTQMEQSAQADDWRLPFVRKHYAKLTEALESIIGEDDLREVLIALSEYSASTYHLMQQPTNFNGLLDSIAMKASSSYSPERSYEQKSSTDEAALIESMVQKTNQYLFNEQIREILSELQSRPS